MILRQTHPLCDIEWVVVDDTKINLGNWFRDHMELQSQLDRICYVHLPQKESIGRKRNLSKTLAHGEYIIHMDDDDYYAPNYVETVVRMFKSNNRPHVVGATMVSLMYPDSLFLHQTVPIHANHTCGGIMSYTRSFGTKHHFHNYATNGEEPAFLDKSPVSQIMRSHNIYMVFVHDRNTVPKGKVTRRKTGVRWLDVVQHPDALQFYLSLHAANIPWSEELGVPDSHRLNTREAHGYLFYAQTMLRCLRRLLDKNSVPPLSLPVTDM